ncbi:MAG: hypothetical protein Q8L80_01060 [Gallionella sp.]|nr:hypothetical protein [Gallionella sp.]MDP1940514.1 hypothetical protein [Gallionella sp.]
MRLFCQLWMISVAVIYMSNANALVLGEIQVLSHLGQPLSAKIALADLGATEAQQLKIRLADIDAYNKTDLQYPDGYKFQFRLINEQGTQPFIRVITPYPIDDPYLSLLLETVSVSGKFIKAYTFLLDPSPSWQREPTIAVQPLVIHQSAQDAARQANAVTRPSIESNEQAIADKPAKPALKRKKNKRATPPKPATQATPDVLQGAAVKDPDRVPQMKLAMSLSISSHDPTTGESADALHEELIAKEKTLEDLNAQLGAMQAAIKALQGRLNLSNQLSVDAASGVQPSSETASSVLNTATGTLQTPSPSVQPLPEPETFFEANRLALAFMALLLAVSGLVWYRKSQDVKKNPFDDIDETAGSPLMPQYQIKEITSPVMTPPLTETNAAPVIATFTTEKLATPVSASPAAVQQRIEPSFTEIPEQTAPLLAEKREQPVTKPQPNENKVWPFDEQAMEASPHTEQTSAAIIPPEYAMLLEAKKHLRSGDDNLAEEVLIQAIRANPRNTYGYLVLLSIYEKRADKDSFAALSHRLKEVGDDSSFAEAAEMGRKLDPDNPLYI